MQGAHLSADNLACRKGDRLLFARLSLALAPGDAVQITGANGIGKSSLLRILAGLARPYAGTVVRGGAAALLDERPALDEQRPLRGALAFWCRIDGCQPDTHTALLGIDGLADVPVRYLSTGQRKRAALARLIDQKAPIWLLDEPLNGLDTDAVELVEELTRDHCANGGIAVIASHQPFRLDGMRQLALRDFAAEGLDE
ncbi:MAG: heme ABC exporter ATP-binding protein CcmA [Candidatus Andeanibacterium colombiense]|uniref:Heme ABC exporter ATP-binding protein CcmA n=1 Tax=Candidatus Andeanibacterium colombiense TaxID=3121345 RepID=A0AAJ5XC01_9SPHN|nr:MAG: heme ABC exporter ATP-binding protein CcmA [Sphingomonadaceae bacterium]